VKYTRNNIDELDILADIMRGGRHSRVTVARGGVSLPTADRWLARLAAKVPGVRKVRESQTSWFEWHATRATERPSWEDARVELAQKAADHARHNRSRPRPPPTPPVIRGRTRP